MANLLVQTVTQQAGGGHQGQYQFFTADGREIERRTQPDYVFDPRTRPWYQAVAGSGAPTLSAPYVFFTTQQVGITLSQRSRGGDSVIGMDVVLDDLANSLGDLRVTPRTQLALVNAQHEVLAYPDMSRVLKVDGDRLGFKTLAELDEPSLTPLNNLLTQDKPAALYEAQGQEWLGWP